MEVSDLRIQSLLREKDAEILRLRDKIFEVEKSHIRGTSESSSQVIKVLQDENLKLKNENAGLRGQMGSAELISNYKSEIATLNGRILELEQEKSNLTTELSNLKREYEVRLQVYEENSKILGYTQGDSLMRSPNVRSPVQQYTVQSPDYSARMVQSEYKTEEQERPEGQGTSRTYGLADSGHSGTSATRQAPSYQGTGTNMSGSYQGGQVTGTGMGTSSGIGGSRYTGSGSGSGTGTGTGYTTQGFQSTYQTGSGMQSSGSGSGYQSSTYRPATYTSQTTYTGQSSGYTGQSGYTTGQKTGQTGYTTYGQGQGSQQGGNQQGSQQGGSQQGSGTYYGSPNQYRPKDQ